MIVNKPSWDDAPFWANWLAMDEDGECYWYEDEPKQSIDCWYTSNKHYRMGFAGDFINNNLSWKETLEQRPE